MNVPNAAPSPGPISRPLRQDRSGPAGRGLATGLDSWLSREAVLTPPFLTLGAGLWPLGWRGWAPPGSPSGHHVRALGTGQRWAQPLKAKGLYILSKSYGKRHSHSQQQQVGVGKCLLWHQTFRSGCCLSPPNPQAHPSRPAALIPCALISPGGGVGVSSAPRSSPLSIFCPCPAQNAPTQQLGPGLLRGLDPGPRGAGAGL